MEFHDTPPPAMGDKSTYDWTGIAAALRGNPGKWAKILTQVPNTIAGNIRRGGYKDLPVGQFEAVSRNTTTASPTQTPRADIWARYIGPNGEFR